MPHRYELSLIIDETSENISPSGEFTDDEWELLEEFFQYAEELIKTNFIQSGNWGQLNIRWDERSNMTVRTDLPDWDEVVVFLHKFRPLLLQDERTNFYKIHNLLAKKLDHPRFRNLLRQQHRLYSGKTTQSAY